MVLGPYEVLKLARKGALQRIFQSDTELSFYNNHLVFYVCLFVRPYVAVSKAEFAENVHIVLSGH